MEFARNLGRSRKCERMAPLRSFGFSRKGMGKTCQSHNHEVTLQTIPYSHRPGNNLTPSCRIRIDRTPPVGTCLRHVMAANHYNTTNYTTTVAPGWCFKCSKCQGGIGYRYAMRKRIPPEILVDCGRNCWIFQSYLAILIVIRRDTTGSPCRSRSRRARGWNETTRDSTSHSRSNRRRVTHD